MHNRGFCPKSGPYSARVGGVGTGWERACGVSMPWQHRHLRKGGWSQQGARMCCVAVLARQGMVVFSSDIHMSLAGP